MNLSKIIVDRLAILAKSITAEQEALLSCDQKDLIFSSIKNLEDAIATVISELPEESSVKSDNILDGITLVHTGTELSSTINVKARSFELTIGSKKIVVEIEDDMANIQYVAPSVEGTVIWCQLIDNTRIFYDTESGQIIEKPELRKRNPQFYQ